MTASARALPRASDMPARVEQRFRELAHERAGIVIGAEKSALLAARVAKRLRALGMSDYAAYLDVLESDPSETQRFVNVITTNTTAFWREPDHFPELERALREKLETRPATVRIWCAASSTGQEPYTIALSVAPLLQGRATDLKILATDIDTDVLKVAAAATYPAAARAEVPEPHRSQGFVQVGDRYRVAEHVRRLVRFAPLNLTRPPFPMKGPIDFIFCRNVMIYLDRPARAGLAREFERLLAPGGLLFTGHSESLAGLTHLAVVRPSVYTREPR